MHCTLCPQAVAKAPAKAIVRAMNTCGCIKSRPQWGKSGKQGGLDLKNAFSGGFLILSNLC